MNKILTTFSLLMFNAVAICSCHSQLLMPIKGGTLARPSPSTRTHGDNYYIKPATDLSVRAVEDCRIVKVFVNQDSNKFVLAEGHFNASYGNLRNIYVTEGEIIRRGQVIGSLFASGSIFDNSLQIYLQKDGKAIIPNW
jgi:hypothetical protein